MQRLDRYMMLLGEMRALIDRSQFDAEALIDNLDYDAEMIVAHVAENIYFEQYTGLLRGTKGTLVSGAGNTLDQSVLLASLLKDAGYEARIARGTLNNEQAAVLLDQMFAAREDRPWSDDRAGYRDVLEKMARLIGGSDEEVELFVESASQRQDIRSTSPFQDALSDRDFILQQLRAAGITPQQRQVTSQLLQETADYFWVEYRFGPSDPWQPTHPAFGNADAHDVDIAATAIIADTVPEELQHRFRFQVFVEQKTGHKLDTTALTEPWERPVANMHGVSLSFSNLPNGLSGPADLYAMQEVAARTRYMIPTFHVGKSQQPQSDFFDMNGIVFDKDAVTMGGGAAGVFQTVGDLMEEALESTAVMQSDVDENDEFRALSAQWMEFTFIAPGGAEKTVKRYVIDRIGAANRTSGNLKLANFATREAAIWKLATANNFILSPGGYSEAYILDRYLERIIAARPIFELSLHDYYFPDQPTEISAEMLEAVRDTKELWIANAIEQGSTASPQVVDYRHEPGLLIVSNGLVSDSAETSEQLIVDIANNARRVLRHDGDSILLAPEDAILAGTWATRAEQLGLPGPAGEQVSQWNTRKAFGQASAENIPVRIIKPGDSDDEWLAGMTPVEARDAIGRDLDNGFAVIVPEGPVSDAAQAGWWRVDPVSGETLGMINEGLGSEALKYKVVMTLVAVKIALAMAAPGLISCLQGGKCSKSGCWKSAAIGVLLGFVIGYAVGLIGAALAVPGTAMAAASVTLQAPVGGAVGVFATEGIKRGIELGGMMGKVPSVPSCLDPPKK